MGKLMRRLRGLILRNRFKLERLGGKTNNSNVLKSNCILMRMLNLINTIKVLVMVYLLRTLCII